MILPNGMEIVRNKKLFECIIQTEDGDILHLTFDDLYTAGGVHPHDTMKFLIVIDWKELIKY